MSLLPVNLKVVENHVIVKSLNIVLPLVGIGLMLTHEYCDTSCSYLKGTFLGVDLRWMGILFMAALLVSVFACQDSAVDPVAHLRTILVSAVVGAEFFLIGFRVIRGTYCLFCLAFSACIFILFGINLSSMNRWIMAASVLAGLLGFTLFFEGQAGPRFDL